MIKIQSFDEIDKLIKEKELLLFVFGAPWCGGCRMLMPVLKIVEDELPELTVAGINVDEFQEISAKYDIQAIPTLVLFKNNVEVASHNGFASSQAMIDWIKDN